MLNYTKKYINIVAFCITIFIFCIFIILDARNLHSYKDDRIHRNMINDIENIENSVQIGTAYIEMSKRFRNNSLKKENENKVVSVNDEKQAKEKDEKDTKVEKLTNINIYSTNKWRIKIPKINLDAPIAEGTSQESLRRTVGHFEETDTWKGNVALAGHNSGYRCNFFQDIKKLEKGDLIIYSTEKGSRSYKVIVNTVIKETDWSYIENTKDNRITLITCETGKREYRRCIQAVEIKK